MMSFTTKQIEEMIIIKIQTDPEIQTEISKTIKTESILKTIRDMQIQI